MTIKKIEVKGAGKKSAIVEFETGLNVIAGASDTGKSYITKCLQFILGADMPPKPIEQAAGYTHLEVTFEEDRASSFVLSRELKEKADITCTTANDSTPIILKPSHRGVNNLSSFLLSKFDLDNKILAKGLESMNHASLTLRILEKVFLVDEERIISENSPFGTGQNTERTLERSLIKTLLTGTDDSKICDVKEDKQSKASIKQKLDHLVYFLEKFFPNSKDENEEKFIKQLDEKLTTLESAYEQAEEELNRLLASNAMLISERNRFRNKVSLLSRTVTDETVLIERFKVLEKKYLSDRERLEANSEAVVYLEQQKLVNCPVCGNELSEVAEEEMDVDTIIQSNFAEILKIDKHLEDLRSTIKNSNVTLDSYNAKLASHMKEVNRIDGLLAEKVGNKLKENRKLLSDLDNTRSKFTQQRDREKKRQEVLAEIGHLQTDYDKISDSYSIDDFSVEAEELAKQISTILTRWDFPNGMDTVFDSDARDVSVGGKPRSHFGKGYRAICFSAIIIGLMEYLVPKGRHPGFVILDSPLTTYRKGDENAEAESEEVVLTNNLIYAFYRDLCDFYGNKQIIVLENQEPDEHLHSKMSYIHFSQNENVGRYGFFPID